MKVHRILRSERVLLPLILGLTFYVTFIPHISYPYPVHVDEWVHLASANEILDKESALDVLNPFSGGEVATTNQTYEVFFHLYWAMFREVTDIPWMAIFRFFPSVIFTVTVLGVYVLARRSGFGLEAAFFASLTPTTVGVLGPAFLVPMSLAMVFIPLALLLALHFRGIVSYLLLSVFAVSMTGMHVPQLMIVVILLFPYLLLNLRGNFRHSLAVTLALVVPALVAIPWASGMLEIIIQGLPGEQPLPSFVQLPMILRITGPVVVASALVGIFWLTIRGGKSDTALVLGFAILTGSLAIFHALHYGIGVLYYRGLIPAMLIMNVMAGAGLMALRKFRLAGTVPVALRGRPFVRHIGNALAVVVAVVTLALVIPIRQNAGYYHMIDEQDYETFVWISDHVSESYPLAVLDPWKATAFTAITGKHIYAQIRQYPGEDDLEAWAFLSNGSADTAFLKENGISVVYSRLPVDNPDLRQVAEFVYLFEDGTLAE